MKAFIDDGQQEPGYIAEAKGLYPECRFSFRPATVEERAVYSQGVASLSNAEASKRGAAFVAKRLVSWNLDRPITAANVAKLRHGLFDKLLGIIMGMVASDDDPQATPEQREESAEDKFRGVDPGVEQLAQRLREGTA